MRESYTVEVISLVKGILNIYKRNCKSENTIKMGQSSLLIVTPTCIGLPRKINILPKVFSEENFL